MTKGNISYPLFLDKTRDIYTQISTIGIAFNKYNDIFTRRFKSWKVCCIALAKNKIVSIGVNRPKTHPKFKAYADDERMTLHAEADMILRIDKNQKIDSITDIFVVRGVYNPLPSFPCEVCIAYITEKFNPSTILHYVDLNNNWRAKPLSEVVEFENEIC